MNEYALLLVVFVAFALTVAAATSTYKRHIRKAREELDKNGTSDSESDSSGSDSC